MKHQLSLGLCVTVAVMVACATAPNQPTLADAQAHLLAAQAILNQVNADATALNPAIQGAGTIAGIASPKNAALISAISTATQATNTALQAAALAQTK